ncbi:MAG: septum formation initiator family protein [Clostridia bacterium]|nr:septum formation initiator family protein [Clostridia bacterium]
MKKKMNPLKFLMILFLIFYASYALIRQEIEIKKYDKEKQYYMEQIELAKAKQEEYKKYSEYVKTDAFIEKIAREKLGMLLPEEKIYIEYNG